MKERDEEATKIMQPSERLGDDLLDGAEAIARELGWTNGEGKWHTRRVYHLREKGCPAIRRREGLGVYAFRSELLDWLKGSDDLRNGGGNTAGKGD